MGFFDFFDDNLELEDFALIGGLIGEIENNEDEKRKRRESESNPWGLDESDKEKERED